MRDKLMTAKTIYRDGGITAVTGRVVERLCDLALWLRAWWFEDHPFLGRIVEWCGNHVRVDGLWFSVDHPHINRAIKGLFLLNRYERPEREALRVHLDPHLPVVELGASIGVISCLTNRKLANPYSHVVVEANPDLMPLLKRNRDSNDCRFTIVHGAISYVGDVAEFLIADSILASSATQIDHRCVLDRTVKVPAVTLREILARAGFQTCTLICDIECGEVALIEKEIETIREHVSTIVMEIHTKTLDQSTVATLLATLRAAGFDLVHQIRKTHVFERAGM